MSNLCQMQHKTSFLYADILYVTLFSFLDEQVMQMMLTGCMNPLADIFSALDCWSDFRPPTNEQ